MEILEGLQESLADDYKKGLMNDEVDRDQYLGMSLRELVRQFREKTLVLLKCCLLQHKVSDPPILSKFNKQMKKKKRVRRILNVVWL